MLVQVALSLLMLMGFTVFVIDYGVIWVARGQAQNAADAGALAGAVARAFEDRATPPAVGGAAWTAAVDTAVRNTVWGRQPVVGDPIFSWDGQPCPPGIGGRCARVNVFRNVENGNALPVLLGGLLGVVSQGVRATATARTAMGTTTNCLKPWAVADKWIERRSGNTVRNAPWTPSEQFDKWTKVKGNNVQYQPTTSQDLYVRPTPGSVGTGFTPGNDLGLQLVLMPGTDGGPHGDYPSGWFVKLDLPCPQSGGGACYRNNISGCNGINYSIGEVLTVDNTPGNKVGPTEQGIGDLLAKDDGARWVKDNPASVWVPGSPQPGRVSGSRYGTSPRVVPVALMDIDVYLADSPNGKETVTIANMMGFFVEGTCAQAKDRNIVLETHSVEACKGNHAKAKIIGRLTPIPGLIITTDPSPISEESSFMSVIQLVR
ncbi:MAG: hypothetical protein H0X67_02270 [Acidobacteria bacterium]|nr:hypothetical protein [Acidobacteriota bacterium]